MITTLADVIWPALFLESRLLAIPVIIAGLVIEYFFVRRITELTGKRLILANFAMNAALTLLGILLIPLTGIIWEIFPGILLYERFNVGTFSPGTWTATFLFAFLINAGVETLVLSKVFKQKIGKRGFAWLSLANAVSVGIAYASFLIYPI